jgi:small subunit ribosomal protein S1
MDYTSFKPAISRRILQEQARDYFLDGGLAPGDVIRTVVTHLEPFGAFVDIGCGLTSLIGIENISVSRIRHPAERFALHQQVPAVVTDIDRARGHVVLSHKELLGTWEANANRFSPGETVQGIVRTVEKYGIFVELTPNLSGLAEYRPGIKEGDRVAVYIKSILPEKMKIKLVIIDTLPDAGARPLSKEDYFILGGKMDQWLYSPACCRTKQIFTLFE